LPAHHGGLPKNRPPALPKPPAKIAGDQDVTPALINNNVLAALHRKSLEITCVQREIDALLLAGPCLLNNDPKPHKASDNQSLPRPDYCFANCSAIREKMKIGD